MFCSQRSYLETKGWDVFRTLPPEAGTRSEATNSKVYFVLIKILKVFVYFLSFAVVLAGCVIGKGSLLFMTSQVRPHKTIPFCNQEIDRSHNYIAEISASEQCVWIWQVASNTFVDWTLFFKLYFNYRCLFITFMLPEVMTFIRSARICVFKSAKRCSGSDFCVVLLFESMHIVGLALLVFIVFPDLDVVKGAMMTNCMALLPGIFSLCSRHSRESRRGLKMILDLGAILCQLTGFVIWPLVEHWRGNDKLWVIPLAIFCVSAGWWENYVDRRAPIGLVKRLGKVKERLKKTRYFTYSFISVIKIVLFFLMMLLCLHLNGSHVGHLFSHFVTGFQAHKLNVTQEESPSTLRSDAHFLREIIEIRSEAQAPIYVLLINVR